MLSNVLPEPVAVIYVGANETLLLNTGNPNTDAFEIMARRYSVCPTENSGNQ